MAETVIGYAYDQNGKYDEKLYFEGTMENIASFIMGNRWNDTIVTDIMDNLIVKSFPGGFLDMVDPYIREDLLKELIPMQLGDKEPVKIEYLNENKLEYGGWYL